MTLPPFTDTHQHQVPLPAALIHGAFWRHKQTGQKLLGRNTCEIMYVVAPFLGTSLDANRQFYRGPGQGPGTEAEPYLKRQ